MPLPKPQSDESKDEFISRCISQLVGNEDMPQDQAAAICYDIWDKKDKRLIRVRLKDNE